MKMSDRLIPANHHLHAGKKDGARRASQDLSFYVLGPFSYGAVLFVFCVLVSPIDSYGVSQ